MNRYLHVMLKTLTVISCALLPFSGWAADAFPGGRLGAQAELRVLWLSPETRNRLAGILGHPFAGLRVRYWQSGDRTAWVLDETGKEQPITAGFVVKKSRIESVDILGYRESRGGEVQQGFFTRQFKESGLGADDRLDRSIDGITGATLSVSAVTRMARCALVLDAATRTAGSP